MGRGERGDRRRRRGALRDDSPFTAWARASSTRRSGWPAQADPKAQLFYNDYEIEGAGAPKSEAAYQLCKRLKEAGVPIDGIGFQMHVDPRKWPTAEQIRSNVARYAALGLIVEFTEVDVPVGEMPGTIDEKLQQQATVAHDIVAACMAVDKCTGITFWGLTDADSWLNDPQWGKLRGKSPTTRCSSTATSTRSRWWALSKPPSTASSRPAALVRAATRDVLKLFALAPVRRGEGTPIVLLAATRTAEAVCPRPGPPGRGEG